MQRLTKLLTINNDMKQTHLKTLSARIDELEELRILSDLSYLDFTRLVLDANKQSKTTVTLAHFVPCDKNGVPLEEPFISTCPLEKQLMCGNEEVEPCECACMDKQLIEAQKSVIFEGWEVVNSISIVHKTTGDTIQFFKNGNVYYDKKIRKEVYESLLLGTNPTLADLAAATTENPLKLK